MAASKPSYKSVSSRTPWLAEDDLEHELNVALRSGTAKMRELSRSKRYLKPNGNEDIVLSKEGDTLFIRRINRSWLRNVWAFTIAQIARMPFRARIQVKNYDVELQGKFPEPIPDAPEGSPRETPRIYGWVDDMDGTGLNLDKWGQQNFATALFEGIVYAIVDMDSKKFASLADRRAANVRPYVTTVRRCDLVNIVMGNYNGVPRPLMVTIKCVEGVQDISDPNNWVDENRIVYKVFLAGSRDAPAGSDARKVRVHVFYEESAEARTSKKAKGEIEDVSRRSFIVPDDPSQELFDIPIVPLYGEIVSPFRGRSPFIETAFAQLSIWTVDSELRGLLREAAQTFVHLSGMSNNGGDKQATTETVERRFIESQSEQAKLTIVETEGKAAAVLMRDIAETAQHIKECHNVVNSQEQTGPVTAREITLEGVHASSALELWVIQHEHGWTRVLDLMALIGGLPSRGSATIPHDFGLPSAGIDDLVKLFEVDKVTPQNFWREMKNAGRVGDDFDIEAEIKADERTASRLDSLKVMVGPAGESDDEDATDEDETAADAIVE
jgi:hypothetical protein